MIKKNESLFKETLYVVTSIFNPTKDKIRYKLYEDFKKYINSFPNTVLLTVELAIGNTRFVVTDETNPNHFQMRTNDILWYKENLTNIVFKKLASVFKGIKVAWIDADVSFSNVNWVNDTLEALNKNHFVQIFSQCDSLGPQGEILTSDPGFVYAWKNNTATFEKKGRSGGAWAARLDTLVATNYLIDWDIVGASDWFYVFALTNQKPNTITPCQDKNKKHACLIHSYVNCNVSYIKGTLIHYFHGYPKDRGYLTRGQILIDHNFDPDVDIGYREDGLIYFKTEKQGLRNDIVAHFNSKKIWS